jgi:hypothetical protein
MVTKQFFTISMALFVLNATPAMAGFQFTAPVEPSMQAQSPNVLTPMVAAPVPNVQMESVQTMPEPQVNIAPAPSPLPTSTPQIQAIPQPMESFVQPAQQPVPSPQPVAASVPTSLPLPQRQQVPAQTIDPANLIAVGFGNDLPLDAGLKQIIPSYYTYKLDPTISVDQSMSWTGGDQWQVVLRNALNPIGLNYEINGQQVVIAPQVQKAVVQEMPVALPPIAALPKQPQAVVEPINLSQTAPEIVMEDAKSDTSFPIIEQLVTDTPVNTVNRSVPQDILPVKTESMPILPPKQTSPSRFEPNEQQWMARKGDSLKDVLENWSNLASIELFWSSDYDYPLVGDVNLTGDFEVAAQTLLEGFQNARPRPSGRLHPNLPYGPAVLVVETGQTVE